MEDDVGQFAVVDRSGHEGCVRLRTSVGRGPRVEQAEASGCDGVPGNVRMAEDEEIAVSETGCAPSFSTLSRAGLVHDRCPKARDFCPSNLG